jgi:hypothetical protein
MLRVLKNTVFVLSLAAAGASLDAQSKSYSAPEKGIGEENGRSDAKKARRLEQDRQPARSETTIFIENQYEPPNPKVAADHPEEVETQRKLVKFTYYLVWVGGLQFFALLVQALVFWRTLRKIETQANLMREHALHLENLATAARDNAMAARDNAQTLVNSERAWILIDTGDIPDNFEANQNSVGILDVRPVVRNSGGTPGWITRGFIRYYPVPTGRQLPPEPDYQGDMAEARVNIVLAPNGLIQPLHVSIPLSVFAAARHGDPALYVYGFVDYIDFANQERQSRFCFVYHVPHGFDPQVRGFYSAVDAPIAYTQCR